MMSSKQDNISLEMDETHFDKIICDDDYMFNSFEYDITSSNIKQEDIGVNTNIKDLLTICEYYGIAKEIRANKYNKIEIINILTVYERELSNHQCVASRKQLWYYMNELKRDKFMKKFVIWK